MRIGIITFTYGDNYGQRLQNLAVQEILQEYADNVFTIRQVVPKKPLPYRIKQRIKNAITGKSLVLYKRHKAFLEFDRKYISYYDKPISTANERSFPQDEFDCFISGSDQIWSPYSKDVNDTMFLSFAEKKKRIALSPSISAEEIPDNLRKKYRSFFLEYSFLSVREEKGAELIKEVSGRDAEVLIDPTLMFDKSFWEQFIKLPSSAPRNRYCCCYFLGVPNDAEKINDICREYGLTKIDLLNQKQFLSFGPGEFLYMIKNSSLVITDSYHGCIFSILFHVPFIMCERKGTKLNMSSRFATLFNKLGINGRQLQDVSVSDALTVAFDEIEEKLGIERSKVKGYLNKALLK